MASSRRILAAMLGALALLLCATAAGALAAYGTAPHRHCCAQRTTTRHGARSGRRHSGRCHRHSRTVRRWGRIACHHVWLRPTAADVALVRAAVLCLVNRERARHGEAPLRANARLALAAQQHSVSMARGGYMSHYGPRGESPLSRIRATGYLASHHSFAIGENIAWGTLRLSTPGAIVAAWMRSPGHRANILDPRFHQSAVGVAVLSPSAFTGGQHGAIYTQDFGSIGGRGRSQRSS